jgi:membrane protease YdiL (CAAX protease family)
MDSNFNRVGAPGMDVRSIEPFGPALGEFPDRLRPAMELLTVVGLLEAELWSLRAIGPPWLNVVVYGVIVATLWFSHERRRKAGFGSIARKLGLVRSWTEVLVVTGLLCGTLVLAAGFVGDSSETFEFVFLDKPPGKMIQWVLGKFLAALGQQLALQFFLWPVCFELTRSRAAGTILAASIFALIHLPSPTLVAITFVGGAAWVILYQRTGRIAPLVVSHMILATLAHGGLPERLTYDMRVGLTATADMKRFDELNSPKYRVAIRRLKENRANLIHFSSQAYYDAQGDGLRGFIKGLYRDILNRPANDADVAYWINLKLKNPLVDIPTFFLSSDEYARVLEAKRGKTVEPSVRR